MRKSVPLLATAIPRHVWDPTRHNPNWADSYSTEIADRRHWPAKKWSIGLEPRTPEDWRNYSLRNLAYAYNATLRACGTFPEMIPYYQEMKQRGVKVDLDTMNTLLTRAARYEKIRIPDVFELFDEMTEQGAKPDLATAETLHTVWDHSAGASGVDEAWRETRRQHLIRIYNTLAEADIEHYADKQVPHLLAAQMKRYRENMKELGTALDATIYKQYFGTITNYNLLLQEVYNFMWDIVPADHEAIDYPPLEMRIPVLGTAMRRPKPDDTNIADALAINFQDYDVCSVFLSAIERVVDHPLQMNSPKQRRRAYLSLLALVSTSRVLLTSDLLAQLMDLVKFSEVDETRDRDAILILNTALRAASPRDATQRLWSQLSEPCDGRVVGRYIAARDPWSPTRFSPSGKTFGLFQASEASTAETADAVAASSAANETTEAALSTTATSAASGEAQSNKTTQMIRTAADVELRWGDVNALLELTKSRSNPNDLSGRMEVFTGLAMFVRHMFTNQRVVGEHEVQTSKLSFAPGMTLDVCKGIFSKVQQIKREMDVFISESNHAAEPDLECWESLLIVLRGMMDFCVLHKRSGKNSAAATAAGEASEEETFFLAVAELRSQMVEESRTRFDGRFRMLWLQEA